MPIELREYDPTYPAAFAAMQERLLGALGDEAVAIHHLGSTSVPGLLAKPKVDIFIESELVFPSATADLRLRELGFMPPTGAKELGIGHGAYDRAGDPAYALHWCLVGSPPLEAALRFRELLLGDQELRERYVEAKLAALRAHPDDPREYNFEKARVIRCALLGIE
ncbi:MAG: GrpB family protein [Polyangiaceae bacterium]